MNNSMGRESFLAAATKLKHKWVDVPELQTKMLVRELTAGKATELGASVRTDDKEAMLLWAIASVLDPTTGSLGADGEIDPATCSLMFTEKQLPELREVMASVVIRLGSAAVELTGMNRSPEDIVKNSEASPV